MYVREDCRCWEITEGDERRRKIWGLDFGRAYIDDGLIGVCIYCSHCIVVFGTMQNGGFISLYMAHFTLPS